MDVRTELVVVPRTLSVVVYDYLCSELCTSTHRRDWCNICATSMFCQQHKASKRRRSRSRIPHMFVRPLEHKLDCAIVCSSLIGSHLCNRMRIGTSIIIEGNILEILFARTYPNYASVEAYANSKCAAFALTCFYSITFFRLFCLFPFSLSHANTLQFFFSNFKHLFSL